jgi:hypothetical protein
MKTHCDGVARFTLVLLLAVSAGSPVMADDWSCLKASSQRAVDELDRKLFALRGSCGVLAQRIANEERDFVSKCRRSFDYWRRNAASVPNLTNQLVSEYDAPVLGAIHRMRMTREEFVAEGLLDFYGSIPWERELLRARLLEQLSAETAASPCFGLPAEECSNGSFKDRQILMKVIDGTRMELTMICRQAAVQRGTPAQANAALGRSFTRIEKISAEAQDACDQVESRRLLMALTKEPQFGAARISQRLDDRAAPQIRKQVMDLLQEINQRTRPAVDRLFQMLSIN